MPRARAANCAACGVAGSGGERIRRLECCGTSLAIMIRKFSPLSQLCESPPAISLPKSGGALCSITKNSPTPPLHTQRPTTVSPRRAAGSNPNASRCPGCAVMIKALIKRSLPASVLRLVRYYKNSGYNNLSTEQIFTRMKAEPGVNRKIQTGRFIRVVARIKIMKLLFMFNQLATFCAPFKSSLA